MRAEPSDIELEKLFVEKKARFIELRDMILAEDNIEFVSRERLGPYSQVNSKWLDANGRHVSSLEVHSATQVSLKRWEHYVDLLNETGVISLRKSIAEKNSNSVFFLVWSSHISPKPSLEEKYFQYSVTKPAGMVVNNTEGKNRPKMPADINKDRFPVVLNSKLLNYWFVTFIRYGNIPPTQKSPIEPSI